MIEISSVRGSAPREAGTFMLVNAGAQWGTVGGGYMEFAAVDLARAMLVDGRGEATLSVTLGQDSGQCCGGRVELELSRVDTATAETLQAKLQQEQNQYPEVYIFGAGHVGRALALALKPLPFSVSVVETRAEELHLLATDIGCRLEAMPESAVGDIRPGGAVVILTHDHALDFLIAAEALKRSDLAYIGMIGSKTKRGVFAHWLDDAGYGRGLLDRLVLPIGGGNVRDKRPAVIAALVAAELLHILR